MGGTSDERLQWKEPLHSLEVELQREFGLSPICSRALIRRIEEFLDGFVDGRQGQGARGFGQVRYTAVALGERAGKPIRYCRTVPVALTWLHPGDAKVLRESGSPALRRARLARLCLEAHRQGAVLSHEDLSLLLGVEISTVRRLCRVCADEADRPPTRGLVEDIGRTISHKEQIVQLYFRGLFPDRIAVRTGHSLGSVERYLRDFARVAELTLRRGMAIGPVARVTGLSPSLVRCYVALLARENRPEQRIVLDRLLRRFGPCEGLGHQEDEGARG